VIFLFLRFILFVSKEQERAIKDQARITLSLSDEELETLIKQGTYKPAEYYE
jgi:hypothetical protein